MTSCIKVIINDHCQKLNIINDEQEGCVKETFVCKEQLIINTVIMEQARKNIRNIYTTFIDYKIIAGDFNVDYSKQDTHGYKFLKQTRDPYNVTQIINLPTRTTSNTSTIIDHMSVTVLFHRRSM
jgi:hypothetical protein